MKNRVNSKWAVWAVIVLLAGILLMMNFYGQQTISLSLIHI